MIDRGRHAEATLTPRKCSMCGGVEPTVQFHKNGLDKYGRPAFRKECKDCYRICRKVSKRSHLKFIQNSKNRSSEVPTFRLKDWRDALLFFRGRCAYCGRLPRRKRVLTKEHIIPVIRGGLTRRNNIIPACSSCNSSKLENTMERWFRRQAFFDEERLAKVKEWSGQL